MRLAAGLVERMVADVKDQPGMLPLLEFSLTELFDARSTDELSLEAYEQSGGVTGALGRRAEAIYRGLDAAGRAAARQIFMRLVNVTESEGATRRRVRLGEVEQLDIDPTALRELLEVLGDHRLVTFDRDPTTRGPTVEVAHEAILSHWSRLEGWIGDRREHLLLRSRLALAVADWEGSDRSEDYLLNQGRLAQHESWVASSDLSLTEVESEFIRMSRVEADRRRTRERRDRYQVMAVFAATQAIAQLEIDTEQSLLLALEAADIARSAGLEILQVTTAIRRSLAAHRIVDRFDGGVFAAVSPDGQSFAVPGVDGEVIVRNVDNGSVVAVLARPGVPATGAEFSPDGELIAVAYSAPETPLWLWDLDRVTSRHFDGPGITTNLPPHVIAFDDTGDLVATLLSDGVHVWSTTSGQRRNLIELDDAVPQFVAGTSQLLLADWINSSFYSFALDTADFAPVGNVIWRPTAFAVSRDGTMAVAVSQIASAAVGFEVPSGKEIWRTTVDRPGGIAWLSDGVRLVIGGEAGRLTVLESTTGEILDVLRGGHSSVWALAAVPGRDLLVTSGRQDGTTLLWNVEPGPRPEIARMESGSEDPWWVTFAPYPDQLFVVDRDSPTNARIFNTDTMDTVFDIGDVAMAGLANSRIIGDGSLLAVATRDGRSYVLDTTSGAVWYGAPEGGLVLAASHDRSLAIVVPHPDSVRSTFQPVIVEVESGRTIASLDIEPGIFAFFSYNDRLIFDVFGAEGVTLFDVTTGQAVVRLADAMSVRPMPDGAMLSIVDNSGELWHASLDALMSGQTIEEASEWSAVASHSVVVPRGHVANSDGSLVATMGRGSKPARIWDTATGAQVARLEPGLASGEPQVFFHPDEPYVTLLGDGGALLTYTLDTKELVEVAKSRVTRSLSDTERSSFLEP